MKKIKKGDNLFMKRAQIIYSSQSFIQSKLETVQFIVKKITQMIIRHTTLQGIFQFEFPVNFRKALGFLFAQILSTVARTNLIIMQLNQIICLQMFNYFMKRAVSVQLIIHLFVVRQLDMFINKCEYNCDLKETWKYPLHRMKLMNQLVLQYCVHYI